MVEILNVEGRPAPPGYTLRQRPGPVQPWALEVCHVATHFEQNRLELNAIFTELASSHTPLFGAATLHSIRRTRFHLVRISVFRIWVVREMACSYKVIRGVYTAPRRSI